MAPRWIGLVRAAPAAPCKHRSFREATRALGAAGFLMAAAGLNFVMHPQALAQAIGADFIQTFIPNEPSMGPNVAPIVVREDDVRLLAATMFGEARSEGEHGMRAVAHVMVNRIGPRFGEDLSTVILSPKQFSVWNRGDPNRRLVLNLARDPARYNGGAVTEWETAQRVAREVLAGQSIDPTGGALFYHTQAVRPRWSRVGEGRQVIGAHVFYADVPDPGVRATPRLINLAQVLGGASERSAPAQTTARGPRAGRVNGVIQYAPPSAAGQPLPSETPAPVTYTVTEVANTAPLPIEPADVNAAATPTVNGVPVTAMDAGS
ncbi:MAG TPA: cell wall hydrolase [Terricaulis sp.]|nr:cell wall hydrolase [Terricaulis sp.]